MNNNTADASAINPLNFDNSLSMSNVDALFTPKTEKDREDKNEQKANLNLDLATAIEH